jgi:hypothetical protein
MHEALWAGVELKADHAAFFLERMERALAPPERTQSNVAMEASGAVIGTNWQRSLYAYLDAFLAMTRSVPEVTEAYFGADEGSKVMRDWLGGLAPDEQDRRKQFSKAFKNARDAFRKRPLSQARNISVHRTGVVPAEVVIRGRFGVSYAGSPLERVPEAEFRSVATGEDPGLLPPGARSPVSRATDLEGLHDRRPASVPRVSGVPRRGQTARQGRPRHRRAGARRRRPHSTTDVARP